MPIAVPTQLNIVTSTTSSNTATTGSVSPAANALLFLIVTCVSATANSSKPIDVTGQTFSPELTWTKIISSETIGTTTSCHVAVWWAITGSSPGSGTVTVTAASNSNRWVTRIVQCASGFNSTTPIKQVKEGGVAGVTPQSVTLDSAPDSDSMTMGFMSARQTTTVAMDTSGVTVLDGTSAGSNSDTEVDYDIDSPAQTMQWSNLSTNPSTGPTALSIAEIDASAAGAAASFISNIIKLRAFSGLLVR